MLEKAMSLAYNYLSYKPRTEDEMRKYLCAKGYPEDIIIAVIEKLKDYKYLNDNEYASNFHKSQVLSKGYGPLRIQYKLLQKGISKEQYQKVETDENIDYYFIALSQAQKKLKGKKDMESLKKVYGYLMRRGFPTEIISRVISKLKEEEF